MLTETTVPTGSVTFTLYRGGAGSPLVYLHGFSGVTPSDPLVEALSETRDVVAPVQPGFLDLDDLEDIRDVHDLALAYDDLFDTLGLEGADVIGHSLGGMVAAELAAHVPHRVGRLVLCAPVGLWNDAYPTADLFTEYPMGINALLWADPGSPVAQETMAAQAATARQGDSDNPLVQMLLRALPGLTTATKFMWPLPDKGLSRRLRRVKAKTLLVWGSDDKLNPVRYADDFLKGLRDARVEVLEGAGHMAPWERRDAFVKLVTDFLA